LDDDVAVHLFAMVPIKHLGLAPDGARVEPLAAHAGAFCELVAPSSAAIRHDRPINFTKL
jgi:hypothetical protein